VPVTFVSAGPAYNLAYEILSNNAPANGSTPNQVRFTLRNNTTNQPASNQLLNFSASGTANIVPQSAMTDINGQVMVDMTSTVMGSQQLTGYLQSTPAVTVSAPMNFTDSLANYQIHVDVITNNAAGNAIAQNQVRFTLTNSVGAPLSGRILDFTPAPGMATLQFVANGTTNANGEITVAVSASSPSFYSSIKASLREEPTVSAIATMAFSRYQVAVIYATAGKNVGVQDLLASVYLRDNGIENSNNDYSVTVTGDTVERVCSANYVFNGLACSGGQPNTLLYKTSSVPLVWRITTKVQGPASNIRSQNYLHCNQAATLVVYHEVFGNFGR
ncbi:TPA: Ig-like domain-containing protein, partial [Yersinia enterocolitica]